MEQPLQPITECSNEERYLRALILIDCLAGLEGTNRYHTNDKGEFVGDETLDTIYEVAHAAAGLCGNPHEDWMKIIEKMEDSFKEGNIVDMKKALNKDRNLHWPFGGKGCTEKQERVINPVPNQ